MVGFEESCPRLAELTPVHDAKGNRESYLDQFSRNFTNIALAREYFARFEKELQGLDGGAWSDLKKRAERHIWRTEPSTLGLRNLLSILNERKGYNLLKNLGFRTVRFNPEGKDRTPDLEASNGIGLDAILEIKSIWKSDRHRAYVENNVRLLEQGELPLTSDVGYDADAGLKHKFEDDLSLAQEQLSKYRPDERVKRIVAVVLELDDDPSPSSESQRTETTLRDLGAQVLNSDVEGYILRPGNVIPLKEARPHGIT